MVRIGEYQIMKVSRRAEIGLYLGDVTGNEDYEILLPNKSVPVDAEIGDEIEVFIYRDSEDRLIATTRRPLITVGELAYLEVVEVTDIGAFVNWGLEKDLFLPFSEQTTKVKPGHKYMFAVYVDKSDRLSATMKINRFVEFESDYKVDDKVEGIVYEYKEDFGALVLIDNKYSALLPKQEIFKYIKIGDKVSGRVTLVMPDGKLRISIREAAHIQMDEDSQFLLDKLRQNNGVLHLNDKSHPEDVKFELNMSKRAFKRAIGRLLKEGKIEQTEDGIKLIEG